MKPEITKIEDKESESPHAQEIEFALLLSKMINTVKQDPAQLRLTVYQFARAKLTNELSWANQTERERLLGSLETAIRGVERFSVRTDQRQGLPPPAHAALPALLGPEPIVTLTDGDDAAGPAAGFHYFGARSPTHPSASPLRKAVTSISLFFAFGGLFAGSIVAGTVYLTRGNPIFLMRGNPASTLESGAAQNASLQPSGALPHAQLAAPQADTSPGFPIPSDYGVYALNEGKLSELNILPEQVPDKRVAMSTPVTQPSRTTLPNGRTKFIVYRRDIATSAPERVDVRIVAQVRRSLSFDSRGKPTFASVNDAWNIRNISHEFRVRPVAGHAEMLLIQPENVDFELPAGRYVLVLNTQGYDFTVAGQVTDPSQCLERTEAANGIFYSACQKS